MRRTRLPIVGREAELAAVALFVAEAGAGPESLVLAGTAGIGKTAIWAEAVAAAADNGTVVRSSRCTESDAVWAFAGLGDLLEGLPPDLLDGLPEVQQRALAVALLASDETVATPGSRVVGVALLEVLRALSSTSPLLLAVDDVQWLDLSTRNVLSFALRRLVDEPIRLLASYRTGGPPGPADEADLGLAGERMVVGPVTIGTLQRITQTRLGTTLSRPTLTRLHQATGGNPMMCLEMARSLQRRGTEPAADEPLSVPADLRSLVAERLGGLSAGARRLLLVCAALGQPTVVAATSAMADQDDVGQSLREAVAAGVLEVVGERVRFMHPLIASVPYADLTPAERRGLHATLAATVTDPEEHARHSALGSVGPSAVVAAALDVASRQARNRGGVDAAVELAELAVARTPDDDPDARLRRSVELADCYFLLGDPVRARSALTRGLEAASPGPVRVRGLLLQASIASWEQGDATVAAWCEQALAEAGDDTLLQAMCHATFAETCPSGATVDLAHAHAATRLLESLPEPPPVLMANALTNIASHGFRLGLGLQVDLLERAVVLQSQGVPPPVGERAEMSLGMYLKAVDRFDEARTWLTHVQTCAADEGDESAMPMILGHLAILECWSGEFPRALGHALEGRARANRIGFRSPMLASSLGLTLAHMGRLDEARSVAEQDIAVDEPLGFESALALHYRSLGFTELMAGNNALAAGHLVRAWRISLSVEVHEPGIMRLHADAVQALVGVGDLDAARSLTDELEAANRTAWTRTMLERCRALLSQAAGDVTTSLALLENALVLHQDLPMPFEEGRTRLLFGKVLRRAGHRTAARRELDLAHALFERLAAPVQVAEVQAELGAISGRRVQDQELTAVEGRVAALVREGRTNREVAATLFVSVRTVESHLGRIYRKRGVRSRTELATSLGQTDTQV